MQASAHDGTPALLHGPSLLLLGTCGTAGLHTFFAANAVLRVQQAKLSELLSVYSNISKALPGVQSAGREAATGHGLRWWWLAAAGATNTSQRDTGWCAKRQLRQAGHPAFSNTLRCTLATTTPTSKAGIAPTPQRRTRRSPKVVTPSMGNVAAASTATNVKAPSDSGARTLIYSRGQPRAFIVARVVVDSIALDRLGLARTLLFAGAPTALLPT